MNKAGWGLRRLVPKPVKGRLQQRPYYGPLGGRQQLAVAGAGRVPYNDRKQPQERAGHQGCNLDGKTWSALVAAKIQTVTAGHTMMHYLYN